jgi:FAD/FMN-containing dehydrogenase
VYAQSPGGDALAKLKKGFEGTVVLPGDPDYDAVRRVWNGMHVRHPAVIARCTSTTDVSAALRFATEAGLAVTVRGGGHNVAGTAVSDDTVMIDLSLMREVSVARETRVAYAQGGCLLADVDAATTSEGLACPAGVVSHTGLAGLALGGGYGWLGRKWGLTCDHIIAAEVVLADGTVVVADRDHHPELFWALRGGGGNFGIVTRFTLRLREVGPVHHQVGIYPLADMAAALAQYQEFAEAQSGDLHAVGTLKIAGNQEWIPAELRGTPALFLTSTWLGDPEAGPTASAPLYEPLRPAASVQRVMSYAELQALGDHGEPHGNRYFTKSCYLSDLSAGPIEGLIEAVTGIHSPLSSIDFEFLRGAICDVPDEDSAFPRREAPYICTASAQWTDPAQDPENIAWTRSTMQCLEDWQYGGAYVNYLQDEPDGKVLEVYGDARYRRLAAVKDRYDPANVLSGNQNIRPSATN